VGRDGDRHYHASRTRLCQKSNTFCLRHRTLATRGRLAAAAGQQRGRAAHDAVPVGPRAAISFRAVSAPRHAAAAAAAAAAGDGRRQGRPEHAQLRLGLPQLLQQLHALRRQPQRRRLRAALGQQALADQQPLQVIALTGEGAVVAKQLPRGVKLDQAGGAILG
jgi:hypothetical protein